MEFIIGCICGSIIAGIIIMVHLENVIDKYNKTDN